MEQNSEAKTGEGKECCNLLAMSAMCSGREARLLHFLRIIII